MQESFKFLRNKSGSANIPNLRTFLELIYALRSNKIMFQIRKLYQ